MTIPMSALGEASSRWRGGFCYKLALMNIRQGSIRLFRLAGIDVFLHFSWFLAAAYEMSSRQGKYSSVTWNVLEYVALFAIVLIHEFGHALACRSVGGTANRIMLWPLGGVAYVDPPPRPGATLWSIAAGPLVNVALLPVLFGLVKFGESAGWAETMPDFNQWIYAVAWINAWLLIFNILPIYPLDGGQILRSLLWFVMGRARSLMAATVFGFIGVAGMLYLAVRSQSVWFGLIAVFIVMNCWSGLQQARALSRLEKLPKREGFACPSCKSAPMVGAFWGCGHCGKAFDIFEAQGVCPHCGSRFDSVKCFECGRAHPLREWVAPHLGPTQL
jgi:Zn-dependent protease